MKAGTAPQTHAEASLKGLTNVQCASTSSHLPFQPDKAAPATGQGLNRCGLLRHQARSRERQRARWDFQAQGTRGRSLRLQGRGTAASARPSPAGCRQPSVISFPGLATPRRMSARQPRRNHRCSLQRRGGGGVHRGSGAEWAGQGSVNEEAGQDPRWLAARGTGRAGPSDAWLGLVLGTSRRGHQPNRALQPRGRGRKPRM